jgi:single-strand DNA-binding protein
MNKIMIIGNLGRDPEMRYTTVGQPATSFSVASNHRYKTASGEQREETEWFNCQAFGKLAESCNQYLSKGQQVYVEGRLKSLTYQTRDGQSRFSNDVTVTEVQFLSRPELGGYACRDGQG